MLMQQNDEMQEQFKRFSSKEACSTGAEHAESMKPPHSSDAHDDPYGRFSTSVASLDELRIRLEEMGRTLILMDSKSLV